ncbi:MAG: aerobic carbon-monoxide dehydrogenase large subunit [Alphaproteobacteria bacterium]|jgi:carbon-monoxide dehydrogenase large subunit|nr:aerobic carbon-monoxide dehydrogenase large subunit [Alphaproteobacteria bacterium]
MRTTNRLIGSPIARVEDFRFLRGRGEYIDDVSRDNQLCAFILRSPLAHGRIKTIDTRAARDLPGVHAVITAADLPRPIPAVNIRLQPLPSLVPFHQPVLAHDKVRYVGEPIAVVLAASAGLAEDAAGAIGLDIEPLQVVIDRYESAADKSLLFEAHGSNLAIKYTAFLGDADAAFKQAPYTRKEHFSVHRHAAVPMEPRGLLAEWDAVKGRLTLYGAAKVPFFNRHMLAEKMGLTDDAVDLIENDVGGGFGARGEFYPEDFLIPFAARLTGRPIKWTEDRRENLMAMQHARDADCEVEIACSRDGTILALRGQAFCDVGAYIRTNGLVAPRNIAQFMSGPYRIPNIHLESHVQFTNKTPSGTYRGPGRYETDFFRERLFDLVARDLGIDRVEFRRRNLVSKSEMPYRIAKITPYDSETEYDSGNYASTLKRCLDEFHWVKKSALDGRLIDGRHHGIGLGCFIEGGGGGPKENARMVVERDGSVTVSVGSSAIGQGLETVFAQIAADALEMSFDRVRVLHGSTTLLREGYGSYHSRAVVMGGSAILATANALRETIREAAAKRFGCSAPEITIEDEKIMGPPGKVLKLAELASDGLTAEGSFPNVHHTYSYGAHAAHVAIDAKTGHVEIIDYVAVEDVGRIINPATLRGQVLGAVVQGLGGTFLERFDYDQNGQPLSASFADYLMPTASDFPNIRAFLMEEEPSPINPLGAKGAGEGGIIPVGGVIANAVASALRSFGAEPCELPLSPVNVWKLIRDARPEAHAAQ